MSNTAAQYTHMTLWTAFQHLVQMYDAAYGNSQRKDEALALRLAALSIGFFALEAFLNHLIQAVSPDVWKNERQCFSGRQPIAGVKYCGPVGKLRYVCTLCRRNYDENAEAIQTVVRMKELRDMMAHGRSYYDEPDDVQATELESIPLPTSRIFELATHKLLVSSDQHLNNLRISLFEDAQRHTGEVDLGPHPSSGISGVQMITVRP